MGDYEGLFCHAVKKDRLDFKVVGGDEGGGDVGGDVYFYVTGREGGAPKCQGNHMCELEVTRISLSATFIPAFE